MGQNVKKKAANNIYYGETNTGERKHIDEVPSGTKCACNCILCKTPLVARKGSKRRHHFAHVSNYDCMYAGEVAVYQAIADIISKLHTLCLPPIYADGDIIKKAQSIDVDNDGVEFQCEPKQYPPMLSVTTHGYKLRVLIEFGAYYSKNDLSQFETEAREKDYSIVLFCFPDIDKDDFFKPEHLKEILTKGVNDSRWIRSAFRDKKQQKYFDLRKKNSQSSGAPIFAEEDDRDVWCVYCGKKIKLSESVEEIKGNFGTCIKCSRLIK